MAELEPERKKISELVRQRKISQIRSFIALAKGGYYSHEEVSESIARILAKGSITAADAAQLTEELNKIS